MSQTDSHVEHDSFIKWVSYVDQNIIQTRLNSTYDLFINGFVRTYVNHVRNICQYRIG